MPKGKTLRERALLYASDHATDLKSVDHWLAGHRANRLTRAEREVLRAVHAMYISTKYTPPGNLSRQEWLKEAAFKLWRPDIIERAKGRK